MSWQLLTAARTLWQEARGEPDEGRRAVAHVFWNRLRSRRWGDSLASVCLWRAQFSGWLLPGEPNFLEACALPDDDPLLVKLLAIIVAAESEPDPTKGATHYFSNTMRVAPAWALSPGVTFLGVIGHQRFYKNVP